MVKDGNGLLEDRLIFLDFDNAGFGYRAFDLIYFVIQWPVVQGRGVIKQHSCSPDLLATNI